MLEKIKSIFYFFPFRLILNHIRENFMLSFSWVFILLIVIGYIGTDYGVPILFLNPEYFGIPSYFSFQVVGICFGIFFITWNLTSYLLYSFRYPFVASLKWPFAMFTFNNSIIPFVFLIIYIRKIIEFQHYEMAKDDTQIFWMVLGIFAGFLLVILLISVYFMLSNSNIFKYIKEGEVDFQSANEEWENLSGEGLADRVDFYLTRKFRIRPVRDVTHYDDMLLKKVFQKHHLTAFLIIVIITGALISLGFVADNPIFELPAAGSMFLFFSLLISLAGIVYHWSGKWGTVVLFGIIFLLNSVSKSKFMQNDSQAYGMNYEQESEYSIEAMNSIIQADSVKKDISNTIEILEAWKQKNKEGKSYNYKPKMFIVLSSGGGSRASTYTMKVMQTLDSLSNGELMDHTFLMSGASGGMMGLAYYRELCLRNQLNILDDLYNEKYTRKISADLINRITTTIVSNDLFFGFRKFKYNERRYTFDRGTAFEIALNNSTDGVLDKAIKEYESFEKSATIPMMFVNTINVSDLRKLIISPQPISYMMSAQTDNIISENKNYEIDAIDFCAMFKKSDALNLRMSSAVRMNATYPLILPNVSLPSVPKMDVFDAGIRDNFGIENTTRFLNVFQNWINKNTSGVVIIQIRDNVKHNKVEDYEYQTFVSKLGSSFGSIYSNITNSQDYLHDYMLDATQDALNNKLEVVSFEYQVPETEKRASMSLRLSETEFHNVVNSAIDSKNQEKFEHVIELMK